MAERLYNTWMVTSMWTIWGRCKHAQDCQSRRQRISWQRKGMAAGGKHMKLLIAGLFVFTSAAFASTIAPVSYHDGTLVAFSAQGSDDYQAQYMVKSEGILYALTPVSGADGSIAERAMLGWSKAFNKNASLDHAQPGTPLLLRDDGKHVFVKVGNRESMYVAIEAR